MFQSIGERLNKFASIVIRQIKKYLSCQKIEATEMNLMFATGMLSSIIITTGAAVFSRYEGWTYFDSFYYCFVTLTTIGFGDYVALQVNPHGRLTTQIFHLFSLPERQRPDKQTRLRGPKFSFHLVRFGGGRRQHQLAGPTIHDDVSR